MHSLLNARFLLNTGKGGVGKTTITIALARLLARQGKRVLVMELNAFDRLGPLFGKPPVGPAISELAPGIFACNVQARDAMEEYVVMLLKSRTLYRTVFENRVVSRFLKVVPGLPELLMLGKAYFHEAERDERGNPRWDVILIDAPATGHGLFLLRIPHVIATALSSGHMVEEARNMMALLQDPVRTRVNLVTLPEEMPVAETLELAQTLHDDLGIARGAVFVNGLVAPLFSPDQDNAIRLAEPTASGAVKDVLAAARFRSDRATLHEAQALRMEARFPGAVIRVPFFFESQLRLEQIDRIAERIGAALGVAP